MNLFIVEDSAIILKHLLPMLSDIPGVTVMGHAADEAGAIERINALRPDVVTLDLRLQPGSGLNVLKHIKKHHARIKVMVLTGCTGEAYVNRCRLAGADCFFDKASQIEQLCGVLQEWAQPDRFDSELDALQIAGGSPVTCRSTSTVVKSS